MKNLPASLIVLFCLMSVVGNLRAETIACRVVDIHDGDTITVLSPAGARVKIRLDGIDAPELDQSFGQEAKQALSDMVFGRIITLQITGTDRYERVLVLAYVDKFNVNLSLVSAGFAWHYAEYSKDVILAKAQVRAQEAQSGLWQEENPTPPWEWRIKGENALPRPKRSLAFDLLGTPDVSAPGWGLAARRGVAEHQAAVAEELAIEDKRAAAARQRLAEQALDDFRIFAPSRSVDELLEFIERRPEIIESKGFENVQKYIELRKSSRP
ncbi:MAG TPA: hypothetical protein DDZ88_22665 [Verrucomicrobiales bacterium]|nr:hypothetical protein [Verrucomicrobiales bacterium]